MPTLIFQDHEGNKTQVAAEVGDSVMQAAVNAGVGGILADCGGGCSCATCHCFVDSGHFPDPDDIERSMLECVAEPSAESRLSCQLVVTDGVDNVVIRLPESQV